MKTTKKVKIPRWKAYLYSLIKRYKIYKRINMNMLSFGLSRKELGLREKMQHKFLRKEEERLNKANQLDLIVNRVLGVELALATKEEIKLAEKYFTQITQINIKELQMELKQIKAFAKEVGLGIKDTKDLDEDELIIAIIKNLDGDAEYTPEFVEWYESIDDAYFTEAETTPEPGNKPAGKTGKKETKKEESKKPEKKSSKKEEVKEPEEEEIPFDDLEELINEAGDKEALAEIVEEYDSIFEIDLDEYKTTKKAKAAMLEALEEAKANAEGGEGEEEGNEDDEALIEAFNEAETAEELKVTFDEAGCKEDDRFKGIPFRSGKGKSPFRDVDDIRNDLLKAMGQEVEEVEEVNAEVEITSEMVNEALEAEDKETLKDMCDTLDIELKLLEKRNCKAMARKLLEVVKPAAKKEKGKPGKAKKEEIAPAEEKTSAYQIVEEMVNEEAEEADIVEAVKPIMEARGKKSIFIKKWVKQMIEVVKADYGI